MREAHHDDEAEDEEEERSPSLRNKGKRVHGSDQKRTRPTQPRALTSSHSRERPARGAWPKGAESMRRVGEQHGEGRVHREPWSGARLIRGTASPPPDRRVPAQRGRMTLREREREEELPIAMAGQDRQVGEQRATSFDPTPEETEARERSRRGPRWPLIYLRVLGHRGHRHGQPCHRGPCPLVPNPLRT